MTDLTYTTKGFLPPRAPKGVTKWGRSSMHKELIYTTFGGKKRTKFRQKGSKATYQVDRGGCIEDLPLRGKKVAEELVGLVRVCIEDRRSTPLRDPLRGPRG